MFRSYPPYEDIVIEQKDREILNPHGQKFVAGIAKTDNVGFQ